MSEVHYYSNYAETRDIDCFFKVCDVAYHFASNGQPIPSFITRKTNMAVQDVVYELLENTKGEVRINEAVIEELILKELTEVKGADIPSVDDYDGIEGMVRDYAESFVEMARLGFVSMDLDSEGTYHVIAYPIGHSVSEKVMRMLPEVGEGIIRIR